MGSVLTHTFGTYTVFRTIHSIYENTNDIALCIVAFTPCDDMMLSPSTMEYELQDVFDTFDYLLKNQFDFFAKSAIYDGNSSPLNISELVNKVIEIMEKNYNFYRCSIEMISFNRDAKKFLDIEIVKPIEDVYVEKLTGIRSSAPALIRDMNS